jgi:hypothetical protein
VLWKQNELRVGILFLYIEAHKTKKCLSVKLDYYSSMVYESYVAESRWFCCECWKGIKPTPLTEEWLLKLGFKRN